MIAGLLLMILGGILLYLYFKDKGISCINNPLSYYETTKNTSCWCVSSLKNMPLW